MSGKTHKRRFGVGAYQREFSVNRFVAGGWGITQVLTISTICQLFSYLQGLAHDHGELGGRLG